MPQKLPLEDVIQKALEKTIAQIQEQIDSGDVFPKERPAPLQSDRLTELRAARDRLTEQRKELRNALDPNWLRRKALVRRLAYYEKLIQDEDYAPKKRPAPPKPDEFPETFTKL
jgi:DNA repair exonuclease SbcCD ATPase subunit